MSLREPLIQSLFSSFPSISLFLICIFIYTVHHRHLERYQSYQYPRNHIYISKLITLLPITNCIVPVFLPAFHHSYNDYYIKGIPLPMFSYHHLHSLVSPPLSSPPFSSILLLSPPLSSASPPASHGSRASHRADP